MVIAATMQKVSNRTCVLAVSGFALCVRILKTSVMIKDEALRNHPGADSFSSQEHE